MVLVEFVGLPNWHESWQTPIAWVNELACATRQLQKTSYLSPAPPVSKNPDLTLKMSILHVTSTTTTTTNTTTTNTPQPLYHHQHLQNTLIHLYLCFTLHKYCYKKGDWSKFCVVLRPLIKSFLRRPSFPSENHSGGRRGNWRGARDISTVKLGEREGSRVKLGEREGTKKRLTKVQKVYMHYCHIVVPRPPEVSLAACTQCSVCSYICYSTRCTLCYELGYRYASGFKVSWRWIPRRGWVFLQIKPPKRDE